ncbi:hypothetical protein QYM36_016637 [Artemia franciscana]|uniref:Uncharacterized protein n=1 Tax=Artemia franciscana TaxID=6661 RepID=A0AA88KV12_ARTSF|nr:hypothetical protein QYM36_016637 [Artemia franciscana]
MATGIDAANQNDDEILCPVKQQKSVSMLLGLLKEVFGNVKKVPGGKDNVKEICDRILVLHQNAIEENSELPLKENRHLQTIVKLQEHIGDLNKTPISMIGVAQPTSSRSFASAIRGPNVYSVILEPVEYDKNSDKRLGRNDLQKLNKGFYQAIDKDSKNFAVEKTVPAKNGKIKFELASESDAEEAISAFNKKVEVTKYKAVQVKKRIPRIIVYDVTECEDADSFLTEFLRSSDNVKDMVDHGELLKVVTVLWKDVNRANVVLEVSPKLRSSIIAMATGIDAANQNDDEILCPVKQQKSVSMLLGLLKEVFGNVKKVPGGKDNVKEICDRILVLHQNAIEENSELPLKENRHLQTIVKLQEHIGDLNKTPISMIGVAQPTSSRSFASAIRGPNVCSVILEPVEYDKNSDKRLGRNDLQKLNKGFYQAIDKDSKNFISDAEEAVSAFNKKVEVTKYKAVQVKKRIPRIIVYDVTECEDANSFLTEFLRSSDNVKDMVDHGELLKVVTVLWKDGNRANVVLEVSPKLRRQQVQYFLQNVTSGVDEINADVLKDAIDSLKPMKAPGPDGILNLVLKKILM